MAMESADNGQGVRTWTLGFAVLGVLALAMARFVTYINAVQDTDVTFAATMAWWGTFVIALGLIATGLVGYFGDEMGPTSSDWAAFLVGALVLVIMPSAPMPDWASMFSGMMGGFFGP